MTPFAIADGLRSPLRGNNSLLSWIGRNFSARVLSSSIPDGRIGLYHRPPEQKLENDGSLRGESVCRFLMIQWIEFVPGSSHGGFGLTSSALKIAAGGRRSRGAWGGTVRGR